MATQKSKLTFRLSLPSRTDYLGLVSGFVTQAVRACGGSSHAGTEVALAVDEALTNIIQHAYDGNPDHTIEIRFAGSRQSIELRILHNGRPISPDKLSLPDLERYLETRHTRGLGLHIMTRLMDEVAFSCTEDRRTECRMVRKLRRSRVHSRPSRVAGNVAEEEV